MEQSKHEKQGSSRIISRRDLRFWNDAVTEYADLDQFCNYKCLRDGLHTIYGFRFPLDVHLQIRPGQPLVIWFHGATPPHRRIQLPFFQGLGISESLPSSIMSISDPTLYASRALRIAWFAGSRDFPLQTILLKVIAEMLLRCSPSRTILAGGSSGGFAALYYSRFLSDSLTLVWNPQTNILAYDPGLVARYGRTAFGFRGIDETRRRLSKYIHCDLTTTQRYTLHDPPVIYMQNRTDHHTNGHLKPFLRGQNIALDFDDLQTSCRISEGLWLYFDDWGHGHIAPNRGALTSVISELLSQPLGWRELFSSNRLAAILSKDYTRSI